MAPPGILACKIINFQLHSLLVVLHEICPVSYPCPVSCKSYVVAGLLHTFIPFFLITTCNRDWVDGRVWNRLVSWQFLYLLPTSCVRWTVLPVKPIFDLFSFLAMMHFFNLLKPTGHVMHQQFNSQQLYALPTLFMCFVFIWEQTATCATYSINWLVFITEIKSVYCAVRTGSK